jgi:hypothetical protein
MNSAETIWSTDLRPNSVSVALPPYFFPDSKGKNCSIKNVIYLILLYYLFYRDQNNAREK